MPEITAEQLAERKRRVCEEMGPNSFVASLTGEQWDHIIACLREHESRAATVAKNATVEPVSDPYKLTWRGRVAFRGSTKIGEVWDARRLSGQWRWALPDGRNGLVDGETDAKLAVEKAVRNA